MSGTPAPPLVVAGLAVTHAGGALAVRGVDLTLPPARMLGLVGESGCGKSTLVRAVLRLFPGGTATAGSVTVAGHRVLGPDAVPDAAMRRLRGRVIGHVGQDPFGAFDPRLRLGAGIAEAWRAVGSRPPPGEIAARVTALGVDDAAARLRQRPHQWSGGMLARAAVVAATAHAPALLLADEPTAALDADRADAVLARLRPAAGGAALVVGHDLVRLARHCDDLAVMYAGRVVEHGPAASVLEAPRHPYTAGLVAATPRPGRGLPEALPGEPPPATLDPHGCAFAPRCSRAHERCAVRPPLRDGVACWTPR